MTRLEILHERRDEGRCERTARVPLGLGCTNGHFPGLPIVPGFVQLGWAIETARTLLGGAGPRRIEALKFKQLLRPGETIVLIVERSARSARFSVERGGVLISSGRLVFDGAPAAP
jgi:3-hydroxymyristoyl/3-hydroxydecanoyl-(acyl carrier protein) dehydratase